jgi:hypothetical protein
MKKYFVIEQQPWGALEAGIIGITTDEEYAKKRAETWAVSYKEVKNLDSDSIKKIRKKKLKKINKYGKEITN